MIDPLKVGGTFLLNCTYGNVEEIEANCPPRLLKQIAEK